MAMITSPVVSYKVLGISDSFSATEMQINLL